MNETGRNRHVFNVDACTRCGECFHRCPELSLPLDAAQDEIKRLIDGRESRHVLAHCTTCRSCNHFCPYDCKPYQLILERWNDLYNKRGAPYIYRFVCPTMDLNIWQMLELFLTSKEKAWIEKWQGKDPQGDILLIGNYVHLLPFVVGESALLDHFTPVDILDHWECGAYLYQGGYLDMVKQIGEKCRNDFSRWPVKRIVPLLDAVHWMITDVLPNEMNIAHDFEVVNFHQWLLEKIDRREILLKQNVGLTVTIHDNCYSKAGGGQYWDAPREIIRRTGCEIIEMAHIRENALCCGFGAGASWNRPMSILFDIMDVAGRKLKEAEDTGADAMVSYCGGCLYLLWTARELFGSKLDIYHLVEIQRMAMGEKLDYPEIHVRRAWDLIAIITYLMIRSLFGGNFRITEISMTDRQWKPRRFVGLRLIRLMLRTKAMQYIYKKGFRLLLPLLRSKRPLPS